MQKLRYGLVLAALLALTGAPTARAAQSTARCAAVTPDRIAALFEQWNRALKTLDPDKVTDTYAADAVLLPTVENGPLIGRKAIRGYFVGFLKKHPEGTIESRSIRIGCNIAFDAGLYSFTLDGPEPGRRATLAARYTYIYEIEGGRWLIVHHHSSALPQPGAAH